MSSIGSDLGKLPATFESGGVEYGFPAALPLGGGQKVPFGDPQLGAHQDALKPVQLGQGTLEFGAKGPHVKAIQQALVAAGYPKTPTSGVLDRATQKQIAIFQKDHKLPNPGIIDQETLLALDKIGAERASAARSGAVEIGDAAPPWKPEILPMPRAGMRVVSPDADKIEAALRKHDGQDATKLAVAAAGKLWVGGMGFPRLNAHPSPDDVGRFHRMLGKLVVDGKLDDLKRAVEKEENRQIDAMGPRPFGGLGDARPPDWYGPREILNVLVDKYGSAAEKAVWKK